MAKLRESPLLVALVYRHNDLEEKVKELETRIEVLKYTILQEARKLDDLKSVVEGRSGREGDS